MSELLEKARMYEAEAAKKISRNERPFFHLTPVCGWMNDPNGFSYYKGKYHLFYQYNPYDIHWASMHWGHAVSDDMLHWQYLPCALSPDKAYDVNGCFSGTALQTPEGKHLLIYTGVKQIHEDGVLKDLQVQCLAVGDGKNYTKCSQNPVIDSSLLPEGASKNDFRDPKIWILSDGRYCCAVANRAADGSGQILLFTSSDAIHWTYWKALAQNKKRYGTMWECPDFFPLGEKYVLLLSPQDMIKDGEFNPGNGTLCIIGNFDEKSGNFTEESVHAVDSGIDFYAEQTVLTPDGRRVMIGWMQNWDDGGIRENGSPWAGMMSLPRELFIKNGRLWQKPAGEFTALRDNKVSYSDVKLSDRRLSLDGIEGRICDIELNLRPDEDCDLFAMRVAEKGNQFTEIIYRVKEHTLSVDRSHSGSRRALLHSRECKLLSVSRNLALRIVLDRNSLEIFINGGEQTMSLALYTEPSAKNISFRAKGDCVMDVTEWTLCSNN